MGRADDIFWADFLGVAPEEWETPGLSIRKHAGLTYCGLWSFRRTGWLTPLSALVSRLSEPIANLGAVGVARRVGYERYANHLAVRLRRDTREIQP